jgi:hypothetical protein
MTDRKYSRAEVDAILGRALERESSREDLDHEELLGVAREIGVSPAAIERAAGEILAERRDREELAALRREQWLGFGHHVVPFLGVNALLILLNWGLGGFPWALFPLLGWGIGLFSHFMAVAFPNEERLKRRIQRRRERAERLAAQQRRRERAQHLGSVVEAGVTTMLELATERLKAHAASPREGGRRVRVEDEDVPSSRDESPRQRRQRRD